MPGIDVAPAVADQKTAAEFQLVLVSALNEQAWFWLTAIAGVFVIVIADKEIIDRQRCTKFRVYTFDHAALLRATGDVGLIGHHQQKKSALF